MTEQFFMTRNEGGSIKVDGRAVRKARYAAGLTQKQLAERMWLLGYTLSQPYVSMIETSQYPWGLSERMATALGAALGVGLTTITGGSLLTEAESKQARTLLTQVMDVVAPGVVHLGQSAVA